MVKKASKPSAVRADSSKERLTLYLCCFSFDQYGDRDWHGTFQVVVEAKDPMSAIDVCQKRIEACRGTDSAFTGPITIFAEGIIELAGSFADGLVVNVDEGEKTELDPRIMCLLPEQPQGERVNTYDYYPGSSKPPDKDGPVEPFLDFGGVAVARARTARQKAKAVPLPPRPALSPLRVPITPKRKHAKPGAEKARRDALRETMAELGLGNHSRKTAKSPSK